MIDLHDQPDLALINAVVDGNVSAADAGRGMSLASRAVLALAEKLGDLSRGDAVRFEPKEAGQLHAIIDDAAGVILAGKMPTTAFDRIARRFMGLAFEIDDPANWAFQLSAIRDGAEAWAVIPAGAHSDF
ncbi:MAG: hypothetical protein AB7G35_00690 [Hyphomicrobiaceae bacterium]